MNRLFLPLSFFLVLSSLSACASEQEKLDAICNDLQTISAMTDDCSKMASSLKPATAKFSEHLKQLNENVPDSERLKLIDSVSKCNRAYLEIQTGSCADDSEVKSALPNF